MQCKCLNCPDKATKTGWCDDHEKYLQKWSGDRITPNESVNWLSTRESGEAILQSPSTGK